MNGLNDTSGLKDILARDVPTLSAKPGKRRTAVYDWQDAHDDLILDYVDAGGFLLQLQQRLDVPYKAVRDRHIQLIKARNVASYQADRAVR